MRIARIAALTGLVFVARVHAQPTPTPGIPPAPQNLPVVFENDDPRDGAYEAGTDALVQAHFAENVPITLLVVPCGPGSTATPYQCVATTYHDRYRSWIAQYPGLIEIGQHGLLHTETFATLTRTQQLDLIDKGLQVMSGWGLPRGRPFTFAPPFASENADTVSVLEQELFRVSIRNSDTCIPSDTMQSFCESISLCARDANGNRVAGPSCVLLSPNTLIRQVNARQADGKVFLVYHVQDLLMPNLTTVDPAKITALRAILQAFQNEQSAGHYRLMTFETYYDTFGPPPPTPTPGGDAWVYQDFLAKPWVDNSWSAGVQYYNTSPVFAGTRSIAVAERGWGAFSVHSGALGAAQHLDPADFQGIDLKLYAAGTGFTASIRLENDALDVFPEVIVGSIPPNQWVDVSASMSQLNPAARLFDRFEVFDHAGGDRTYYVDDVLLVGSGPAGPTPTSTPTPIPPTRTPTPPPASTPTRTFTPTSPLPTPTGTLAPSVTPTPRPSPTATPTPTAGADLSIFQDALAAPWINASWSATVDFANPSPVFAGTRSIKVAETGWGALSVHSGKWGATRPIDPVSYQALSFRIFAAGSGFNVGVRLENDARDVFPEVAIGTIAANQWVGVTVPMSSLDPAGRGFDRVDIRDYNGSTRTYYVDELRLVGR